jgi:single-stranded DNA-binding protein
MRLIVEGHINQSFWKTADGQNRSKIECIVDTVAPVLRWATALVEKNARPIAETVVDEPVDTDAPEGTDVPDGEVVVELAEAPF